MLKIIGGIIHFSIYWGITNKINYKVKMEAFGTAGELAKNTFFNVVKSKSFISRFFFLF